MTVPDQATPFEREPTDRLRRLAARAATEPTRPMPTTVVPGDRPPSPPERQ